MGRVTDWLAALWPLAAQRSPAKGPQLVLLGLGMTVACALLAAGPVYARALRSAAIEFALREEVSDAPGIEVIAGLAEPAQANGGDRFEAIVRRTRERLGWFMSGEAIAFRGPRLFLLGEGASTQRPPVAELRAITGMEEHVTVVAGQLPDGEVLGAELPLVVGAEVASALGLEVGDRFNLTEEIDTCAREIPSLDRPPPPPCTPTASLRFAKRGVVVAVIEPRDSADPFWVRGTSVHFQLAPALPETGPVVPVFVPFEQYQRAFQAWWPGYYAQASSIAFADPSRIGADTAHEARQAITSLRAELEPLGAFVVAPLGDAIGRAEAAAAVDQGPLLMMLAEVSAIAVYFVFVVGLVAAERNADELALLRARGASLGQVMGLETLSALWTGLPAFVAGPFLAAGAVSLLGLTPVVPMGEPLAARPTGMSFLLSGFGALLGIVAAAVPAVLRARRAGRERRAITRPAAPAFQRYYMDIAFGVVAALFIWELEQEGSAFAPAGAGGIETDPLAMLAPAVAVLAAAALSLRLYPLVARVARWWLGWHPTASVALWRIEREPAPHVRLALLVLMAAVVAAFAASYGPTVEAAQRDRALFAAPVPIVGELARGVGGGRVEDIVIALQSLDGVADSAMAYRGQHALATVGATGPQVNVLALKPAAAARMSWFRADFAERTLRELMLAISGPSALPALRLPADATALSLWVNSTAKRENVTLWARVRDSTGRYSLLELGKLDETGWRELRANLVGRTDPLVPPVEVVALLMTEPPNQFNASDAPLYLDDLAAVRQDGSVVVVESFEGTIPWATLPTARPNRDQFEIGEVEGRSGSVGIFRFRVGQTGERRGIFVHDVSVPIPALATASFLTRTGIGKGGRGLLTVGQTVVPFEVREVVAHFPSLPEARGPALVFDIGRLAAWVAAFDLSGRALVPSEVWLALAPGRVAGEREAILRQLTQPPFSLRRITVQAEELERATRNPLLAAGGSGAFALALGGAGVVTVAGLVSSAVSGVSRRRTELAVLRVMGSTPMQLGTTFVVEYALAVGFGVLAGFGIGSVLSRHLLRFLNVDEAGETIEPPFRFVVDWGAAAAAVAILVAAVAVALLVAWDIARRVDDASALRMGYNSEG